jgi:hypothetical protein
MSARRENGVRETTTRARSERVEILIFWKILGKRARKGKGRLTTSDERARA